MELSLLCPVMPDIGALELPGGNFCSAVLKLRFVQC